VDDAGTDTPAWYADSIAGFLAAPPDQILGALLRSSELAVDQPQTAAWTQEIDLLRTARDGCEGHVFLEFDVPRPPTPQACFLTVEESLGCR
jgi:hypothetical protein